MKNQIIAALAIGIAALNTNKLAKYAPRKALGLVLAVLVLAFGGHVALAGTDATAMTDAATTAFAGVATLCVAIGTFFVVYRLVKKIR